MEDRLTVFHSLTLTYINCRNVCSLTSGGGGNNEQSAESRANPLPDHKTDMPVLKGWAWIERRERCFFPEKRTYTTGAREFSINTILCVKCIIRSNSNIGRIGEHRRGTRARLCTWLSGDDRQRYFVLRGHDHIIIWMRYCNGALGLVGWLTDVTPTHVGSVVIEIRTADMTIAVYSYSYREREKILHTMGYSTLLGQDIGDGCFIFRRNNKSFF